ncbi:hypothetical protein C1J03_08130 [Sulfitobacter sp. SK012]|uniref:hypothetical protein n=1 Tax=Sulfitobacter sp. SK012 TaxID=1389005 RepID=UPI000E0AB742|nr:hypothetical protein [Sulfitobacter sp. SK012]AXI45988.1 hypothetical protein C1J03_08130 [Sulfitobacter sp. SK012]
MITKITTCCHCGTRAVLRLDGVRHTLSCDSCGAPLSRMKALPMAPKFQKITISHQLPPKRKKSKKVKKTRRFYGRWLKNVAEDVFDFVEDVFD